MILLTEDQENELAYIIGDWYLMWKHTMVIHKPECTGCGCMQYRLGYAKEQLKTMISAYMGQSSNLSKQENK